MKKRIYKAFLGRKLIKDNCLKFASYSECDSLLKQIATPRDLSDIKFRKSVDDLNQKLDINPSSRIIKTENFQSERDFNHTYFSTKGNIMKICLYDKLVKKIKINNERNKQKIEEVQIDWEKKIVNRKLLKNLDELKKKYQEKIKDKNPAKTYYFERFQKVNLQEINSEQDNVDQILRTTNFNFSQKSRTMSLTDKILKNVTLESKVWTPRPMNTE